ncbi:unnamed protein product [Thlaspi arvense]|uniref:Uncharacterized protein n=1 Tax=Thlaspi arvense TaxID=13288 RepID=A0AAU9SIM3_THLAR|nr:unnamed protein product [Thlaspi arvense]
MLGVCEICHSVARNVASRNEMIEEEEVAVDVEGGGGGDAAVGEEDGGSSWQRQLIPVLKSLLSIGFHAELEQASCLQIQSGCPLWRHNLCLQCIGQSLLCVLVHQI